jgi:hypothetical protein
MRTPAWILLLVALFAAVGAGQQPPPGTRGTGDLETDIQTAKMNGKYRNLLRVLWVPEDRERYGPVHEFGLWTEGDYHGHGGIPRGYLVYIYPHWFLWGERVERRWGPEQATGAPDTDFSQDDLRPNAWTPGDAAKGMAWLELGWTGNVDGTVLLVWVSTPRAVARITAFDAAGGQHPAWQADAPAVQGERPGIAVFPLRLDKPAERLKLYFNLANAVGPLAVDAVGLLDRKGRLNWAVRAAADRFQASPEPGGAPAAPALPEARRPENWSAVDEALGWLARHQTPNEGFWDADAFREAGDSPPEGLGYPLYDSGLTGLSLLAYLGAGHTHQKGLHRETIGNALKYLKRIQDPEGCFGVQQGHFMYNHAICTLAIAEAYGTTNSPLLRRPVEKGVAFLLTAQNDDPGGAGKLGWRYTVRPGDNDTSVTAWAVLALRSAKTAGIRADFDPAFEGAKRWIEKMTDPETGRIGYVQRGVSPVRAPGREQKWPRGRSEAITAAGLFTRILIGENPQESEPVRLGTGLLLDRLPSWDAEHGTIDPYYWYYGTLALFQVGESPWKQWQVALKSAILDNQRREGPHRGSWDPLGPWGADGGRVYMTAILTLCLEVYYRSAGTAEKR